MNRPVYQVASRQNSYARPAFYHQSKFNHKGLPRAVIRQTGYGDGFVVGSPAGAGVDADVAGGVEAAVDGRGFEVMVGLHVVDHVIVFGKAFGKHKLAPTVSPNKTVEGFIGGIVGALAIAVLMYFWKLQSVGLVHVVVIGVLCSVFGQLGDLVESMWKRSLGIKDSSALIPGHGGVLDRFDSLLFAAPVLFIYLRLMM